MINPNDLLNMFGENGPIILYLYSLYILWSKNTLYFYYNIGFVFNTLVNIVLKVWIKQSRPPNPRVGYDYDLVLQSIKNDKSHLFKPIAFFNIYGMPSGHAQSVLYSTIFIYLSRVSNRITSFFIFLSFLTLIQRIAFNFHTLLQVIVGTVVGTVIAYIIYTFSQQKLKGKLREKPDDEASSIWKFTYLFENLIETII